MLRQLAQVLHENDGVADRIAKNMSESTRSELATCLVEPHIAQSLQGHGTDETAPPPPSQKALWRLAVARGVPFVGFGFMDNLVMILTGDAIDVTLGVRLHLSTMAAAGLGNAISDVLGVGLGGLIERYAERLGMPPHQLSQSQLKTREAQLWASAGNAVGVFIGCILGLFPLAFIDGDAHKAAALKELQEFDRQGLAEGQARGGGLDAPEGSQ